MGHNKVHCRSIAFEFVVDNSIALEMVVVFLSSSLVIPMTIDTFFTIFGNTGQGESAKKLDSIFIKINEIHEIFSIHCFWFLLLCIFSDRFSWQRTCYMKAALLVEWTRKQIIKYFRSFSTLFHHPN